jgi:hypothetical protein
VGAHLIHEHQPSGIHAATSVRQSTLKNSSRSAAPLDLFRPCERHFIAPQIVALLTLTSQTADRNSAL